MNGGAARVDERVKMVRWVLFLVVLSLCVFSVGAAGEVFGPQTADAADEEGKERLTAEDIPVSIVTTEVGDWVEYIMDDGSSSRLTVRERWTEHGDDHLIIENKVRKRDHSKKRRRREPTISEETVSVKERVKDLRDLGPNDFVTTSKILVDDQRIDAVVINYVEDGRVVRQSYFSEQVPVYGLVRGVLFDGKKRTVILNLKDFGQSGEDDED